MSRDRALIVVNVIGLLLSVCGLFLPWGTREWPLGAMGGWGYKFGVELVLGKLALAGCIVTAVFMPIRIKRKYPYSLGIMLSGGLVTMLCSLIWIAYPGTLEISGLPPFKALYGAYVSSTGAFITSIKTIFDFRHD
jgi:hypothetical protein